MAACYSGVPLLNTNPSNHTNGVVQASGLRSVPWNGGGHSVDMVFEGRVGNVVVGHHVDEEGERGVLKVGA